MMPPLGLSAVPLPKKKLKMLPLAAAVAAAVGAAAEPTSGSPEVVVAAAGLAVLEAPSSRRDAARAVKASGARAGASPLLPVASHDSRLEPTPETEVDAARTRGRHRGSRSRRRNGLNRCGRSSRSGSVVVSGNRSHSLGRGRGDNGARGLRDGVTGRAAVASGRDRHHGGVVVARRGVAAAERQHRCAGAARAVGRVAGVLLEAAAVAGTTRRSGLGGGRGRTLIAGSTGRTGGVRVCHRHRGDRWSQCPTRWPAHPRGRCTWSSWAFSASEAFTERRLYSMAWIEAFEERRPVPAGWDDICCGHVAP